MRGYTVTSSHYSSEISGASLLMWFYLPYVENTSTVYLTQDFALRVMGLLGAQRALDHGFSGSGGGYD